MLERDDLFKYAYEADLVDDFMQCINGNSPFGKLITATEFFYGTGKTDVVGICENKNVLAFEAKLKDWKKALEQAYRNTAFANLSFIVLPKLISQKVARYNIEFSRRNVGLCAINCDKMEVIIWPQKAKPINNWLIKEARSFVREENDNNCINAGSNCTGDLLSAVS